MCTPSKVPQSVTRERHMHCGDGRGDHGHIKERAATSSSSSSSSSSISISSSSSSSSLLLKIFSKFLYPLDIPIAAYRQSPKCREVHQQGALLNLGLPPSNFRLRTAMYLQAWKKWWFIRKHLLCVGLVRFWTECHEISWHYIGPNRAYCLGNVVPSQAFIYEP